MSGNSGSHFKPSSAAFARSAMHQSSSRGKLPESPEARVAPSTPEQPTSPKCPEGPKYPEFPVPPVSVGHDDRKALKMLGTANACQARNSAKKTLWQLARDLSALEKKVDRELEIAEIIVAFGEWYQLSQLFLDPVKKYDTYLAELVAALGKVRVPTGEGETIEKAFTAVLKLKPSQLPVIRGYPNAPESWRRVAALHRELSRICRGNTYFLSCRDGARAHPELTYQVVSDINRTLERLGVIKVVRVGDQRPNGKASEFRYLLGDITPAIEEEERDVEI